MALSSLIVGSGIAVGYSLYGKTPSLKSGDMDPLESIQPKAFDALRKKLLFDEIYEATLVRANAWSAACADGFDRFFLGGCIWAISCAGLGLAWFNRVFDEFGVNLGFDAGCGRVRDAAEGVSHLHRGQAGTSLRILAAALAGMVLLLAWGGRP
jgi:hypothetical protein